MVEIYGFRILGGASRSGVRAILVLVTAVAALLGRCVRIACFALVRDLGSGSIVKTKPR